MTLAEFNERIMAPWAERFLAQREQTREEFLAECEDKLHMHRRVMQWAKTGEWNDDA